MTRANEGAFSVGALVMLGVLGACVAGSGAGAVPPPTAPRAPAAGLAPDLSAESAGEDTPAPSATVASAPAAAPSASGAQDSNALAGLPPPRPTTIPLGDGELAAGDVAFEDGDLAGAKKHYAAARGTPSLVGLARVRLAKVDVAFDYASAKGNAEVAAVAADLARAEKASPGFGPLYVELGRAKLLLGDAQGCIDALRRGTELLPDEPEAHSQLGVGLLATGHAADAVRELARAVELDPGSGARHGNLGTALMMAGRTPEAIAEYETRVRIDDHDARAHSDLGAALLGTQDLERALRELQRAVQLEPQRASFHSNLGYALQQSGSLDRALTEYREALRLDPKLVSAWINLATALARDPRTRKEARADLEHARALSPDDPRVTANLEELDALEKRPSRADAGAAP